MVQPEVSILITAYNRKNFLMFALNSVMEQTVSKDVYEIVIVKNFAHEQVDELSKKGKLKTVFCDESSLGKFINEGLKFCSGKMIAFLEDDDVWKNTKVERIVDLLKNYRDIGYYHNSIQPILENGEFNPNARTFESSPMSMGEEIQVIKHPDKARKLKHLGRYFPDFNMSSLAISTEIIKANERQLSRIHAGPDTFLFLIALASEKDLFLDSKKLTLYRQHSKNASGGETVNDDAYLLSMFKFTSRVGSAYETMYEYAQEYKLRYLIRFAMRRITFTEVLNSIQSPQFSRLRTLLRMFRLLPYINVFNPKLNLKAILLSLIYLISPRHSRRILARNM